MIHEIFAVLLLMDIYRAQGNQPETRSEKIGHLVVNLMLAVAINWILK